MLKQHFLCCAAGDAMLTACLWKFGIAPTSPDPLWHPDGLSIFDASSSLLPDPTSKSSIPIKEQNLEYLLMCHT